MSINSLWQAWQGWLTRWVGSFSCIATVLISFLSIYCLLVPGINCLLSVFIFHPQELFFIEIWEWCATNTPVAPARASTPPLLLSWKHYIENVSGCNVLCVLMSIVLSEKANEQVQLCYPRRYGDKMCAWWQTTVTLRVTNGNGWVVCQARWCRWYHTWLKSEQALSWRVHWQKITRANLSFLPLGIEYSSCCALPPWVLYKCVWSHCSWLHFSRVTLAK